MSIGPPEKRLFKNLTMKIQYELEQLEGLRSEDTPRRPMIAHTIHQFILNSKSM